MELFIIAPHLPQLGPSSHRNRSTSIAWPRMCVIDVFYHSIGLDATIWFGSCPEQRRFPTRCSCIICKRARSQPITAFFAIGILSFFEPKVDRPVIVMQPAGFQPGSAVIDIFVNLPADAPSRCTCGKPLQPPSLAKRREIHAGPHIPAVRAISGAQAERQFLFPYGIRSGVGDPSFDCGAPTDASVLSCRDFRRCRGFTGCDLAGPGNPVAPRFSTP